MIKTITRSTCFKLNWLYSKTVAVVLTIVGLCMLLNPAKAQFRERVYANTQTSNIQAKGSVQLLGATNITLTNALALLGIDLADLGDIDNAGNAVDTDPFNAPRTRSRLSATYLDVNLNIIIPVARVRVGALVSQDLKFATTVPGTSPVTVKLGNSGGLLQTLLDGLNVQATLNGNPVGPLLDKNSALLGALGNRSAEEITFTPGVLYDGVRVTLNTEGNLASLNLFQNIDVYYAYYTKPAASLINCDAPFDVLFGTSGLVAALGSVNDPWNAIDNDPDSYTSLNSGVNVLSTPTDGVFHTTIFPVLSRPGDIVNAVISYPGALLEAQLLGSIGFQTINHADDGTETVVGSYSTGSLLSIELLSGSTDKAVIRFTAAQPFNRIKIWYGGLAVALQSVRIYDVKRMAPAPVITAPGLDIATNTLNICAGGAANITITNPEANSVYSYYTVPAGGTAITTGVSANGTSFSPVGLVTGANVFYVSVSRNGCSNEASARTKFTINVTPGPLATDINVTGNGAPICASSAVVLTPTVVAAPSIPINNPLFRWYKNADKTGEITNGLIEGGVTYTLVNGVLTINGLTASQTFYVSVAGDNGAACESPADQLKVVPVTINPLATDASITLSSTFVQCTGFDVVVASTAIAGITNPIFKYYKDAAKTQPITNGLTEGTVTYTISAAGVLTISGLPAGADVNYYVTVSGDNTCENATGKLFNVKISNTLDAPLFTSNTASVCGAGGTAVFTVTNYTAGHIYTVYDAAVAGNLITTNVTVVGNTITFSNVGASANYFIEVTGAGGCAGTSRTPVSIQFLPPAPAAAILTFSANGGTTGNICADANGKITLTATTNVVNPTYYFYQGVTLMGSNQTGVFEVPSFTSGVAVTYAVGVSGDGFCETIVADRKSITITPALLPGDPVLTNPAIETVKIGSTLQLKVSPVPVRAVSFQWYKGATLLAETSATLTLTNVTIADQGIYRVVAVGATGCTSTGDATVTVQITGSTLWKSYVIAGGGTAVSGGEQVTYTIHLRNDGSIPISNHTVTDPIPANTTLTQVLNGGVNNAGVLTWSNVNVPVGGVVTRQFVVTVNADLTGVTAIRNIAYVNDGINPDQPGIPPDAGDPNQPGDPTQTGTDIPVTPETATVTWKSFAISGGGTAVSGGENVTYTIHVRNTGNQALTSVIIRDAIPAKMTFVSAANGGTLIGTDVVYSNVAVGVGQTTTLSFVTKVDANLTGIDFIKNIAVISDGVNPDHPSIPPDPADPNQPGDPTKTGTDIPVNKIFKHVGWKSFVVSTGNPTVSGGENVTYIIHVRNTGNQDLTNVAVRDAVPANTTFVSAANGGTLTAGEVRYTGINVPVGQTVTVSFIVKVNADLTGVNQIFNLANVNDGHNPDQPTSPPDPTDPNNPGDPTTPGTVIPVVKTTANVAWKSFAISGGGTSVSGGENVTYTIHLRNTGNQALVTVTIKDAIPANTTFVSAANGGTLTAGEVRYTGINVPVGQTATVSFIVKVDANLTGVDLIRNIAVISDGVNPDHPSIPPDPADPNQPGDPTKTGTDIPVNKIFKYVGWKSFVVSTGNPTVSGGENVTYTIHVRNTGNQNLTNVAVRDAVPANTTFVSAANGGTLTAGEVRYTGINVPVGQTVTVSFIVKVNADLTGVNQIFNLANVNDGHNPDQPTSPPDPTDPNNPGDPTTPGTVIPVVKTTANVAWKSFAISGGGSSVSGGENVTYTIHVRNTGNQNLTNLAIRDAIPANTAFVSAANGGTLTAGEVRYTGINIPVGQTATVSFVVKVNTNLTGIDFIKNIAVISDGVNPDHPSIPPDPADPNQPGDPTKTGTDIPVNKIFKHVGWKSFVVSTGNPTVSGGENVTYTIHVRNTGNQDLTNVAVRDAIPANTTFVSAANGGTLTAGEVRYTGINVPVGQTVTVSFIVKVNADLTGVTRIFNLANVNDGHNPDQPTLPPDPTDPNNPGDPTTPGTVIPVTQIPNFTATLTVASNSANGKAHAGDVLTYTVTIQNTGNVTLNNLVVTGPVPTGTAFASADNGGVLAAGNVNFTIPSVLVGQSVAVTYRVTVNNDLTGISVISNTATVVVTTPSVTKNTNRADIDVECVAPDAPTSVSLANAQICAGTTNTLTVNSPDAAYTYKYYTQAVGGTALGQGTSYTTGNLAITTIFYVEAVRTAGQCVSAVRTPVTVTVLPVLVTPVVTVQATTPNSVTFVWAAVPGATAYEVSINNSATWQAPSSGTAGTTQLITGLTPGQAVTIRVRALGTSACQQSGASVSVTGNAANPFGEEVYIPNAFTPNGDGKNDVFEIYGNAISTYSMDVFNQFGQLIYRSGNTKKGWDGTYNGTLQPNGVYVYKIDVITLTGKEVQKKGTITLIR